jgi:hypothetical protein
VTEPVNRYARIVLGEEIEPGVPNTEDRGDGQQKGYVALSEDERAKGFVRPVRRSYVHVGKRPKYPTRPLDEHEKALYDGTGFVAFEPYPEGSRSIGRYWTQAELESGCGTVTTMSLPLAETYARDPKFYGGTFCCGCHAHFDVGEKGEFLWADTDERVGT